MDEQSFEWHTHDDEENREDDEAHVLNRLTSPAIHEEESGPVTRN